MQIQDLYASLLARGLSGGTVLNLHLALTNALGQAVRWGLLAVNPAAGAQPPRPRRPELPAVDASLARRILRATRGTAHELPAAVAIATGMRRGEILALKWGDLDSGLTVAHVRRSLETAAGRLVFEGPKTPYRNAVRGERIDVDVAAVMAQMQAEETDRHVCFLAPYLPLRQTLNIGAWVLVPFDAWHPRYAVDEATYEEVQAIARAYDPAVAGYWFGAVCVPHDLSVGNEMDPVFARPLSRALLAAMLDVNPPPDDHGPWCDCTTHATTTSENATIIVHRLHATMIDSITGSIVKRTVTSFRDRIADPRIAPPEALFLPDSASDLNAELAESVYAALMPRDSAAGRLDLAISWLELAASNATMMATELRVLSLRSAFETLLEDNSTARLRRKLHRLLEPSDAPRLQCSWTERGRHRAEELTDLEWWFQSFSLLRNAIAHGGPVHDEDWTFDGLSHFVIAEKSLLRAVRAVAESAIRPK